MKYGVWWGQWCSSISGALWYIRGGFVLYEVGDNTRTWFWHDLWCGDNLSKDAYSELLHIATYQKKEEKNCFTLLLIEAQRW
jgi:hypothetical protein